MTGACSLQTQHTGEQEADQNAFCIIDITHAAQVWISNRGRRTFKKVAHQSKIEVGAEVQAHKVIHLLAVPLQWAPDLHEHLLWTLNESDDLL